MIVVVILGILAAVAIPAFTRYVKRSKTSEATNNIATIYQGEVTYYQQSLERNTTAGFVTAAATPTTTPSSTKYAANITLWSSNVNWSAIGFSLDSAHYYQYQTTNVTATAFTARAVGNLDGDGVNSTFDRGGVVNAGEIQGTTLVITNELE